MSGFTGHDEFFSGKRNMWSLRKDLVIDLVSCERRTSVKTQFPVLEIERFSAHGSYKSIKVRQTDHERESIHEFGSEVILERSVCFI